MAYMLVIKNLGIPHIDEAPTDYYLCPAQSKCGRLKIKDNREVNAILTWLITQDTDCCQQSV